MSQDTTPMPPPAPLNGEFLKSKTAGLLPMTHSVIGRASEVSMPSVPPADSQSHSTSGKSSQTSSIRYVRRIASRGRAENVETKIETAASRYSVENEVP